MSCLTLTKPSSILKNAFDFGWSVKEISLEFTINQNPYCLNYKTASLNLAKILSTILQYYEREKKLKFNLNYKELEQILHFSIIYKTHNFKGSIPNLVQTETAIEECDVDFEMFQRQITQFRTYNDYLQVVAKLLKSHSELGHLKVKCGWSENTYEFSEFFDIYKKISIQTLCHGALEKVLALGESAIKSAGVDSEQQKSDDSTTRYAVYLNNRFLPANSTYLNSGVPTSIATARTFKTVSEAHQAVTRRSSETDKYAIIKVEIQASEIVFNTLESNEASLNAIRAKVEKNQLLKTLDKKEVESKFDSMQALISTYRQLLEANNIADPMAPEVSMPYLEKKKNKL